MWRNSYVYIVVIFGCQVDISDHLRDVDVFAADGFQTAYINSVEVSK
jgi:hypothetical protein